MRAIRTPAQRTSRRLLFAAGIPALLGIGFVVGRHPPPVPIGLRPLVSPTETAVYATRGGQDLALDVFRPTRPNGAIVLFFHGGSWADGTRAVIQRAPHLPGLLEAGFTVVSADYRLGPAGVFPANLADCRDALRYCQRAALAWGCDPTRIALMGSSAGAHLAALTASVPVDSRWDTDQPAPFPVRGVIGLSGVYDFRRGPLERYPVIQDMLGRPENRVEASPAHWADASDPSVLLMHGALDTVIPSWVSRHYTTALRRSGVPVDLRIVTGVGHEFVPVWGPINLDWGEQSDMLVDWISEQCVLDD